MTLPPFRAITARFASPSSGGRLSRSRPHRPMALILAGFLAAAVPGRLAADAAGLRRQVEALGRLTAPPAVHPAEDVSVEAGLKALYFEALPWKGQPTRVFAWLGLPTPVEGRVPGVVLVHGGGGTAFKEWVQRWNRHGFAAISIAVEGQTDDRIAGAPAGSSWRRHPAGGPARQGIYGDGAEPLEEQWMYHAVADVVLANSLLRSLPAVDPARIGVCGISWGGVITATVVGIDPRFAFGIPIYGCGHLQDAANQYGRALGGSVSYREIWDPVLRLDRARMPMLWLSWPEDAHFPLDSQAASYRAASGPRMVALLPGMRHSHPAGWNPPDSYAFAKAVVREGRPWCTQTRLEVKEGAVEVRFASALTLDRASLIVTSGTGFTGQRTWTERPAEVKLRGGEWVVTSTLPPGSTAWFVNVRAGELTVSSEFQEIHPSP